MGQPVSKCDGCGLSNTGHYCDFCKCVACDDQQADLYCDECQLHLCNTCNVKEMHGQIFTCDDCKNDRCTTFRDVDKGNLCEGCRFLRRVKQIKPNTYFRI